ncbi:MAG: hypothetical protein HDKAJFGB_03525 [Anaerolineae bacterium]|nr:hypothetical protein [Anaerolineae bacterium]
MPFRQFFLVGTENDGHVTELRRRPTKRVVQENVFGERRNPFVAAHDVRNFHQMVVNHNRHVVRRKAVAFQQHLVVNIRVRNRNVAVNKIGQRRRTFQRYGETHHARQSFCFAFRALFRREPATATIITRWFAARFLFCAHLLEFVGRAVTIVRRALGNQLVRVFFVKRQTFRLMIWSVRAANVGTLIPIHAKKTQGLHDEFKTIIHFARLIGILDAQNKFAVVVFCPQPIE